MRSRDEAISSYPDARSAVRFAWYASVTRTRLLDKLEWIGENAEFIQHQALQGDEWKGCYKYRVGDYRIIYRMKHPMTKLIVLKVGHRREVYK